MATINTTPARNSNTIINNAFDELKKLFKNVEEYEAKNPGKTFGYAGLPGVLNRMREMEDGITKIFFVGRDYHGRYEDDDCYFTYWDEEKKEFFSDEWSTRFAAPSYDLYEMPIDFTSAWNEGLIDKNAYLDKMKSIELDNLSKATFNSDAAEDYNLRVKVNGGRKFKGEGYLVRVDESSYRYATPMFRSRYYSTADFGVTTTRTAIIWNPLDNTINRANMNYIEFIDKEEIMEKYSIWAKNVILSASNINLTGVQNRSLFTLDIDYSLDRFFNEIWVPAHQIGDVISTAYDPETEEKKKKESEFRAKKMPEIIEWVKNNTDKQGSDIIQLAIHIYNKRYTK